MIDVTFPLAVLMLAVLLALWHGVLLWRWYFPPLPKPREDGLPVVQTSGPPMPHRHRPMPKPYLEDPASGMNAHLCAVEGCWVTVRQKRPREVAP